MCEWRYNCFWKMEKGSRRGKLKTWVLVILAWGITSTFLKNLSVISLFLNIIFSPSILPLSHLEGKGEGRKRRVHLPFTLSDLVSLILLFHNDPVECYLKGQCSYTLNGRRDSSFLRKEKASLQSLLHSFHLFTTCWMLHTLCSAPRTQRQWRCGIWPKEQPTDERQ